MKARVNVRFRITVCFGILFLVTSGLATYLLKTNKDNSNLNWLMTAALFSFAVMVGNLIVILLRRR
ncbi:hypothetical protein COLU111180_10605 [Cohnella lubricantis]|uniref:Uncharacterized protein n=1 Tax=Cohnella lubricantis TaxID=2163172 RepID=A0A841TGZ1_9BACL|nr:hypothetical protein [Cohnella lubricantis]MBB6678510.1 hypothetical protein [Cohnella lubricantis]MBP2118433.1 hypothetical protein [Cohnella lubricantis]